MTKQIFPHHRHDEAEFFPSSKGRKRIVIGIQGNFDWSQCCSADRLRQQLGEPHTSRLKESTDVSKKGEKWDDLAAKKKPDAQARSRIDREGHILWREGLRRLLDNPGTGIVVIGEAAHVSDAIRKVSELRPDILVSKLDRLEVLRRLRRVENVKTVILTAPLPQEDLEKAVQLGVRGLVLRGSPVEELIRCIRWVAAGGTSIRQNDSGQESIPSTFRASFHITDREMQMIEAVIAGRTNKQIARRFRLSVDTVKHHLTNIFNKTGASNRLELVLFAIEKKAVDSSQLVPERHPLMPPCYVSVVLDAHERIAAV